nr:protein kinase [Antrihabitans stalactiti]
MTPGSEFAGYTIERLLGAGGMGTVYLARHPRLPRYDALKVLSGAPGGNDQFRARFEREADLASRLRHPNIVTIYDRGAADDQLWIAMEYVDGIDAAHLMSQPGTSLTAKRAVAIVADAAKGLDYAHRSGLLHRDVKPANILVTGGGDEDERALIADFGIARSMDESQRFTVGDNVLATLAYAAPEQLEGDESDSRADIYALGCTLYELLTGSTPYPYPTLGAIMRAHMTAPPPRPTERIRNLPARIDAVIARAMDKNPDRRYSTCRELAEDATQALTVPLQKMTNAPFTNSGPQRPRQPEPTVQSGGAHRSQPQPTAQPQPTQWRPPQPTPRPFTPQPFHSPAPKPSPLAGWSLGTGILGLISCFTLIGGFTLGVAAVWLGLGAVSKDKQRGLGRSGMATAGIILGALTLVATIFWLIYVIRLEVDKPS